MRLRAPRTIPAGQGFTMLELMIALAIVGLLISVALPSYLRQTLKSNRAAGKVALSDFVSREEAFFADRKAYTVTLTDLNYPANTVYLSRDGGVSAASTGDPIYAISLTAASTVTNWTIQAVAQGKQVDDKVEGTSCTPLTITYTGTKSPTACWQN